MAHQPRLDAIKRRFSEKPLLFELIPPELEADEEFHQKRVTKLDKLLATTDVDGLNIPEIHEEDAKSDKGERKSDFKPRFAPRDYTNRLRNNYPGLEYVICRVVVHAAADEQEKWLTATANEENIRNIVLVGGEKEADAYDGLSVPDGNKLIREKLNRGRGLNVNPPEKPTDYCVGNISIPTRRLETLDEPQRISYKIKHGADFFYTQIIYEADSPTELLVDLDEELDNEGLTPPAFFWSFSPISEQKDVNFMRWLGVEIPESVEDKILGSDDPVAASINHSVSVLNEIKQTSNKLNNPVLNGVNVSFMGMRNFDNAIRMARRLEECL